MWNVAIIILKKKKQMEIEKTIMRRAFAWSSFTCLRYFLLAVFPFQ